MNLKLYFFIQNAEGYLRKITGILQGDITTNQDEKRCQFSLVDDNLREGVNMMLTF